MIDLEKCRAALPMPKLMEQLGLGDKAKPNCRCPWHDDKNPSFGIFEKDGRWYFKCHSNCGSGDEIDLLMKAMALPTQGDAIRHYADMAGVEDEGKSLASTPKRRRAARKPKATPAEALKVFPGAEIAEIAAHQAVAVLTPLDKAGRDQLAKWRDYTPEFVEEIASKGIVGTFDQHIAFPVGNGVHFRKQDGSWRYSLGATPDLFVLGVIEEGAHVHIFESQWDALAFAEATNTRDNIVASRGAGNVSLIVDKLRGHTGTLFLWPQNDDAGADWATKIATGLKYEQVKIAKIPAYNGSMALPIKDLNDWRKAGATSGDVLKTYLQANEFISQDTLSEGAQHTAKIGQPVTSAHVDAQPTATQVVQPAQTLPNDNLPAPVLADEAATPSCNASAQGATANQSDESQIVSGEARESTTVADDMVPDSRGGQNSLATILDGVVEFMRKYITFPMDEHAHIVALWIAHAWVYKSFAYTPYLHVCSPEKRCGKTQLLKCIELFSPKPKRTSGITPAALRRIIDSESPTLILDEVDTIFAENKAGPSEDVQSLRGCLNSGFEAGGTYTCCDGVGNAVREFDVFCPKVLAGIGKIPDTIHDRSIDIALVRQASDEEKAARFRERLAKVESEPLRTQLEIWSAGGTVSGLINATPEIPDCLTDRQMDMTEPLLAIADLAGPEWAQRGREAVIEVCSIREDQSTGIRLLVSIRRIFAFKGKDKLTTIDLLRALIDEEDADAPWAAWWESDFNRNNTRGPAQKLARLLEPFGLKPATIRLSAGADGERAKGYYRHDFTDAFKRYLTPVKGMETMELL